MFDIGFSELVLITLVALMVFGPEELPRVARTAGHLLGRLRRYVADVKTDISREMDLADFKRMQEEVQNSAREFESSVRSEISDMQHELEHSIAAPEPSASALGLSSVEPEAGGFVPPNLPPSMAVPSRDHAGEVAADGGVDSLAANADPVLPSPPVADLAALEPQPTTLVSADDSVEPENENQLDLFGNPVPKNT